MAWTEDKIKILKKLWAKGHSTVEIAKELGISKNSVVGKAHRLSLGSRPSPIKRKAEPTKAIRQFPTGKCTLMDLKINTCHWPEGDPNDEDFHFCGKQTVTGKPYCAEHCKLAYTSIKELASQNISAKAAKQSKNKKGQD